MFGGLVDKMKVTSKRKPANPIPGRTVRGSKNSFDRPNQAASPDYPGIVNRRPVGLSQYLSRVRDLNRRLGKLSGLPEKQSMFQAGDQTVCRRNAFKHGKQMFTVGGKFKSRLTRDDLIVHQFE